MKITKLYNEDKIKNINDFKEGEFFIDINDGEIMVKLGDKTTVRDLQINAFSITNQRSYLMTCEELLPIKIEEIIYKEI